MVTRHSLTDTYRTMAHLRRFFESVRRTITTEPTNGGLTPAQQFALLTLAGNPSNDPLTIGDLARETFATMNTTSALVRRMERAGLVRTTRSPKDHRFVYVKLTASGERRLRPSTAAVVEALRSGGRRAGEGPAPHRVRNVVRQLGRRHQGALFFRHEREPRRAPAARRRSRRSRG